MILQNSLEEIHNPLYTLSKLSFIPFQLNFSIGDIPNNEQRYVHFEKMYCIV